MWQKYHARLQSPFQNAAETGSAIGPRIRYITNIRCQPCTFVNDFNGFRNAQARSAYGPLTTVEMWVPFTIRGLFLKLSLAMVCNTQWPKRKTNSHIIGICLLCQFTVFTSEVSDLACEFVVWDLSNVLPAFCILIVMLQLTSCYNVSFYFNINVTYFRHEPN